MIVSPARAQAAAWQRSAMPHPLQPPTAYREQRDAHDQAATGAFRARHACGRREYSASMSIRLRPLVRTAAEPVDRRSGGLLAGGLGVRRLRLATACRSKNVAKQISSEIGTSTSQHRPAYQEALPKINVIGAPPSFACAHGLDSDGRRRAPAFGLLAVADLPSARRSPAARLSRRPIREPTSSLPRPAGPRAP